MTPGAHGGELVSPTGAGAAAVVPLLVTSDEAFGMVDFFARTKAGDAPVPGPADRKGPLTVAFAAEPARGHGPTPRTAGA